MFLNIGGANHFVKRLMTVQACSVFDSLYICFGYFWLVVNMLN